jgi:predicted HAD superfamily Cof-like phosphohydrolase
MRTIKIANDKKRDASVSFESRPRESSIEYTLPDGSPTKNVKILKATIEQDLSSLLEKYGDLDNVAQEIIKHDPEVDFEKTGRILDMVKKLYVTHDNKILYGVDLYEIVKEPGGAEKSRQFYTKTQGNINTEAPIHWSGKFFPKSKAIRTFVFSRKYQIKHVNGLTYDFLYDIAKQLHEKKSLMLIGAGNKGMQPLIFYTGGVPYRGFLEGRVDGDKYCLILHLTNLELKELVAE